MSAPLESDPPFGRHDLAADGSATSLASIASRPARPAWWSSWRWWPVAGLVMAMTWLKLVHPVTTTHESPVLLLALNLVFSTLISILVAYLIGRSYVSSGTLGTLLIGCGVLFWGAGFLAAASGPSDPNVMTTVHNLGVWCSAVCQLLGAWIVVRHEPSRRRSGRPIMPAYALVLGIAGFFTVAAREGWTPTFFVQGQGGTPLRQLVLGSAILMFVATLGFLSEASRHAATPFTRWYSVGLAANVVGLSGVLIEASLGSWLSWLGRASQYLGGVYMLFAAIASVRESRRWEIPLEIALRKREEQFRALFEQASDGIFVANEHGHYLEVNNAGSQMLGFSRDEILMLKIADVVAPEEIPRIAPEVARFADGKIVVSEWRFQRKDGSFFTGEVTARQLPDGRLQALVRDITDRKRAEEELRRSEEHLRLATLAAGIGVWTWRPATADLAVSDTWCHLFGVTEDAVVTLDRWRDALHPDDRERAVREIHAAIEQRGELNTEYRVVRPDGTMRWIVDRGRALRDKAGHAVAVAGVSFDITDRKAFEDELTAARQSAERANQAKNDFLAVLSHELRNPLNPVLATVFLLEQHPGFDVGTHEALDTIRRNVELEARLIDDLLDVTRIERGKLELDRRPVDLETVVRRAVEVCRPDLEARQQVLTVDSDDGPYTVDADAARLQQVFWNLLKNAIKFTAAGGPIVIRIRRQEAGHVEVEVIDHGIGIAPEHMSRLFKAFEQGNRNITQAFGGLGLGLTISEALVSLHGGSLTAASAGLNQGATFTTRLPLLADVERPPADLASAHLGPAPSALQASGLQILMVEDHGDTTRVMSRLLQRQGHTVVVASNIASALHLVRDGSGHRFDLLLSDIGLPDGSGLDLLRELRASGHQMPGIALSGYGQEQDHQRSQAAGFSVHLTKPVNIERLLEVIASLTSRGPAPGSPPP